MNKLREFLISNKLSEYNVVISIGVLNGKIMKTSIEPSQFLKIKKKISSQKYVYFHQKVNTVNYFYQNLEAVITPDLTYTVQHDPVHFMDIMINNKECRVKIKNDKKIDNVYFPALKQYNNKVEQFVEIYKYPDELQTFNQTMINFYEKKSDGKEYCEITISSHFDSDHIDDFINNISYLLNLFNQQ